MEWISTESRLPKAADASDEGEVFVLTTTGRTHLLKFSVVSPVTVTAWWPLLKKGAQSTPASPFSA